MDVKEPREVESNGSAIRRLRKRRGLNVKALATRAGITAGYMSHIELDRRRPSPAVFLRICAALGVAEEEQEQLLRQSEPAA